MQVQNFISMRAEEHSHKQLFQQQFLEQCLPLIEKYVNRVKGKTKKAQKIMSSIIMDVSLNYDKYRLCDLFNSDKGGLITKLLQITNSYVYADQRGRA